MFPSDLKSQYPFSSTSDNSASLSCLLVSAPSASSTWIFSRLVVSVSSTSSTWKFSCLLVSVSSASSTWTFSRLVVSVSSSSSDGMVIMVGSASWPVGSSLSSLPELPLPPLWLPLSTVWGSCSAVTWTGVVSIGAGSEKINYYNYKILLQIMYNH